jgi:hypothetical protein
MKRLIIFLVLLNLISCTDSSDDSKGGTYVKPSVDYKGKYRRGHVRKSVSTSKNAIKNRNRSRYYYETRGKYRRKSKKD